MENTVTHDGQQWSNADEDRVFLSPYNPDWPVFFTREAEAIRRALENTGLDPLIEHFGSTAIPGLAAKPIIDIMLILPAKSGWEQLIRPIKSLGYVHWEENPDTHRMFFVKGMPPYGDGRTHHVHVRSPSDAERALIFRDYLRAHSEEVRRYKQLKRELAAAHETDREAYTSGKDAFVEEIVEKARARQGLNDAGK